MAANASMKSTLDAMADVLRTLHTHGAARLHDSAGFDSTRHAAARLHDSAGFSRSHARDI